MELMSISSLRQLWDALQAAVEGERVGRPVTLDRALMQTQEGRYETALQLLLVAERNLGKLFLGKTPIYAVGGRLEQLLPALTTDTRTLPDYFLNTKPISGASFRKLTKPRSRIRWKNTPPQLQAAAGSERPS